MRKSIALGENSDPATRLRVIDEQTTAHLKAATLDQLDIWADRILDAPTLQAVFDGH